MAVVEDKGIQQRFMDFNLSDYDERLQDKLNSPMPWVGMYVTAASVICSIAMAADVFHGFKTKMLWFPSNYFSLNATTLTLLAVSMKLPVDLTNNMSRLLDELARICSLSLMSAAMGNIIISLGSMDDNEILLNVTALAILVITVIVNVCVQISLRSGFICRVLTFYEEFGTSACLLISLVNLCSSALTVPTTGRYIESKYQEMHKIVTVEETLLFGEEKFAVDKLSLVVKKYYVMAVTGSAQFVMARSVICTTSGLLSVLSLLNLFVAWFSFGDDIIGVYQGKWIAIFSTYKWSIHWIVYVQTVGVAVGTIAPAFRWFTAAYLNCLELDRKSFFKIEAYWIQRLVDWTERPLPLQVRHHKWKKFLHAGTRLILNCCLGAQILVVGAGKLVLFISALFFLQIKKSTLFVRKTTRGSEDGADEQLDLTRYVLLLPGEPGIPNTMVAKIWKEADKRIQRGRRQQPRNLIALLCKSDDFKGVRAFDSNLVPSLHSQESPNCWSLPIVTLTSIAISLPNIPSNDANQLARSISEGLSLLTLIEKSLDRNGALAIIRDAADVVWVGVELHRKWLDKDLSKTSLHRRTSKEMLEELSNEAERTVTKFLKAANDILMENPLNWPVKIIAANSMYRISQTILLAYDHYQTDDQRLFEYLTVVIADIFSACFTNLPHVITMKCHLSSIKERENSVRQAALLLGETQQILEILGQRELPNMQPDKAAFIEEWRAFVEQDI